MSSTYWHKQTAEQPLFPDMLWNQPENRMYAGKLLLISGSSSGFADAAEAYTAATKAGVGTVRVLLPDSLARMVARLFPEVEFAPSTPSGSFASEALAEFLAASAWADGVLLPGSLSKNSETAIVLEKFLEKYTGQVTLAGDAADYALNLPAVLSRLNTVFVLTFAEAQHFVTALKSPKPLKSDLGLVQIVDLLHEVSSGQPWSLVVVHEGTAYVAVNGSISTTPTEKSTIEIASSASVWHLQNPQKPFESLTTALI